MCLPAIKFRLLAFIMLPFALQAQEAKTPEQNFNLIFKNIPLSERKEIVERSVETWSLLPQAEKDSVEKVFQKLQEMRVTVNPELKNYMKCVNVFRIRGEGENLQVWLDGLKKKMAVQENRRNTVRDYLLKVTPAACEQILAVSTSHKWLVRGKMVWEAGEPVCLKFAEADLVCETGKDSIAIRGTELVYPLGSDEITGKGGRVDWREGPDPVSAELSGYRVNVKMSEYTADSVWLHYDSRYDRPILGKLKDIASKFTRKGEVPFPEFYSYATDIRVDSLFRDMTYQGGISYAGRKLTGFGVPEHPAFLHVVPNDSIDMFIYSVRFNIDSARVMSGSASLVIGIDSGQITHPDVNFLYTDHNRTVTVKRITEKSQHLSFKDSYHKILFSMEEILWPLDSNQMELRMGSRSGLFKAVIESQNYFSDQVYDRIQGMDEINPLNGLLKCAAHLGSSTFTLPEYAEFLKKPTDQLRKQVVLLSYNDFVDYHEKRDEVTLKQRLFDYTKARVGKQDYDNIRFTSLPQNSRTNALLDVRNFNLTIFGVDKFVISEAKNVYVVPGDQKVVLLKNRDMLFNGKLNAGMFDMFGSNLYFSYNKYAIDLTKVDSASMYRAGEGEHVRGDKINSILRDIKGDIVIDKPNNKSGKNKDATYPLFNSTKESYVYFDDKNVQDGGYKRDSFYYVVKPYSIRGINDGNNFRYAFTGTLVSNIVSPIEDTLRLMADNSLGIQYKTPASGLEFYEKGSLKGNITLDQRGFLSKGEVNINRSKFQSDTILMLPNRMAANTNLLDISSLAGKRPDAKGVQVKLNYLAREGYLRATSTRKAFDVYDKRIQHTGDLYVYDERLDASGKLELKDAVMQSKLFNLNEQTIFSQQTSLKIAAISDKNIQLNTNNVKATIDLAGNKGHFVNNAEANFVDFSSSRYSCTFKSFVWYMQESYLNIGIEDENELKRIWKLEDSRSIPEQGRNLFLATDKAADSLSFIAPLARYDLKNGDINCRWVNHIDVANGRFYPAQGEVFIQGQGGVRELTGGVLACNLADTTKVLKNVTFRLKGKNNFNGSGDFTYVSEEEKSSTIRFSEILADTNRMIYAKAVISPDQPLALNSGFIYKGNITLFSGKENLFFKGYAGLTADKEYLKHNWLAVNTDLNARRITIPVEAENRNDSKQRIFNGIFLNVDKTTRPYASFLSTRTFYNDDMLIGGRGELIWSKNLRQYIIRDTVADKYYHFRYDPGKYTVSAFGKLNLSVKAPGIYQNMAGDIAFDLKEENLKVKDMLYLIDFSVLGKMEAVMLKDFSDQKLKTIRVGSSLREKIYTLCGKNNIPVVEKSLGRSSANIPDSLNRMFVLDSLDFAWNATTRSYVADGETRLVAVHGKPIDKNIKIKMEIARRRAGDEFFIYLYDDKMWYYFEYSDRALYTLSSNEEYNNILKMEKAEKKIVQTKEKETLYTITLCPDSKRSRFLNRIK